MADVKIGFNQVDKPAPLAYRRFINAYTVMIAPAIMTAAAGFGLSDKIVARAGVCITLSVALLKGLGMILGNGQIYSPSNQVIDAQKQ